MATLQRRLAVCSAIAVLVVCAVGLMHRTSLQVAWHRRAMEQAAVEIANANPHLSRDGQVWRQFYYHRDKLVELGYLFREEWNFGRNEFRDLSWVADSWDANFEVYGNGRFAYLEFLHDCPGHWVVWDVEERRPEWELRLARNREFEEKARLDNLRFQEAYAKAFLERGESPDATDIRRHLKSADDAR